MDSSVQWTPVEGDPFAAAPQSNPVAPDVAAARNRGAQIVAERKGPQPIFKASEAQVQWAPVEGDPFATPKAQGSDIGPLLGQGAAAVVQGVTYPLDKLLGGTLGKAFEDHVGRNLNDIMNDVQATYQSKLSPEQQAASQKEFISGKDGEMFGEAWADPKAYKGLIVSNLPSMVPGFGAGALASRGARVYGSIAATRALEAGAAPAAAAKLGQEAAVKAAGRIGAVAGAATEGIIGGGQQGAQTEQEIMALPEDKLQQSEFYQGLLKTMSPKEARQQIASDAGTQAMLIAGAVDGLTGGAFDSYLAKTLTGGGSGSLLREIGRGMAREGATETVQSGGEQLATNVAVRSQADPTRPLGQDVANQAVQGGIAGGVMGVGAGGGAHAGAQPMSMPAPEAAPPAQSPGPAPSSAAPDATPVSTPPEGPQEPPKALGFQSGPPLVNFPDGTTMTQAEYQQRRADGFTGESGLSPIDQARADAQLLKTGQIIPGADDIRTRNATLVSVYGENAAVRHVIDGGPQFSAIGDAMLLAAPTVERVRGTIQNHEQSRDITSDILQAVEEITRIQAEGKDVTRVLAEGVPHDLSFEGQQLMQFLADNASNSQRIANFLENYLQEVQNASGIPSQVRGRAFDIIQERNAARKAQEEKAKEEAFSKAEKEASKSKAATEHKAVEENRAVKLVQEMAKAKASGSGINLEHKTALELAFENALRKRNEKPNPVQRGPSGSPGGGQPQKPAGPAPSPISGAAETGDAGHARPVRPNLNPASAGAPAQAAEGLNRGKAIAAERRPATKVQVVQEQAKPAGDAGPEAERFHGQYGQGMGERNARDQQKRLAAERPELTWEVAPSTKTPDRFDVVGRKKTVDQLAHEAATSPQNTLPEPTKEQILAGNATLGHPKVGGLDISIESPESSFREDKHNTPPKWRREMTAAHYGYVKGVPARAPDKEHVDVFVKPGTPEDYNGPVFVIDQNHPNGAYDEPKALVGFRNMREARSAYLKNYTPGWEKNIRGITEMTLGQFKEKLQDESAFLKPQRETLNVLDIPVDLKITLPVTLQDSGKTVHIEPNARSIFKEMSRKVNRLQSLLDCLR